MALRRWLIQNLQFPEGNGLDLAGYGEMTLSHQELLAQLGRRYEAIEGVEVWFEFPAAAISGQLVESYGASPASFGLQHVIVRMDSTSTTNEAGEAVTTAPATDAAALTALIDPLNLWGEQRRRAAGLWPFERSADRRFSDRAAGRV